MRLGSKNSAVIVTGDTARTAGFTSGNEEVGEFRDVIAFLNVTAASGTSPTLDITIQDSPDGTVWTNHPSGAFTQTTATGVKRLEIPRVGNHVRAVVTVGGTTPSFTFSLQLVGVR